MELALIIHQILTFYKKCTAKPFSFLVVDATLAIDKSSTFQKESFRKNIKTNHEN